MTRLCVLVVLLATTVALAACKETVVVPASPVVEVVPPSPTVIFAEPTPTASAADARLTVNSVDVGQGTPGLRVDIDVTFENTSVDQDISYSSSQITAFDAENTKYFPECWLSCGAQLKPGEKVRSQMYFVTPEGTQLTQLIWEIPGVLEKRSTLAEE
jgi:hypothetical protein